MQNYKTNKKISAKFEIKSKASKEVAFREIKTEKSITINKFYIYGIIIFFTFILYGNTIFNDYALDDAYEINENKFTQKGINGIKEILTSDQFKGFKEYVKPFSGGRYRPLSIVTFAIEYEFFGLNPHVSHLINIFLYSLTCLLIFILLSKFLEKYPHKKWYATIPFFATILFAAHPVHTEVVAYIKSRDEILSFLFSLLTFWFLFEYLDSKKIIFLFYGSLLFFLALLSKENAIVFIVIFPLTFYFFTNHSLKKIFSSLIPLFVVIVVFIILRQIILSKTGSSFFDEKDLIANSFAEMSFSQKYATIIYTLGLYLKLLFYPHPLTWDYYPYHIPIMEWSDYVVLLSFLIYLFLLYFFFKGLKRKIFFSYCIFLYLVPLSLTSNIFFPVSVFMAERFIYVSSLGFTLIIAYLIVVKPNNLFKILFRKPYILLVPVLFLYSFKTITRNKAWKNFTTIYETDVKTSFNSFQSNASMGRILYNKAEKCKDENEKAKYYELTLQYCDKAFKINPQMRGINLILGDLYLTYKNDLNKSIYYFNNAMILDPYYIGTYNILGMAYSGAQQYDKAIEVFEKALKIEPQNKIILCDFASVYNNLADHCKDANEKAKYYELALRYGEKAYKIDTKVQSVNFVLGLIYFKYKNDLNKSIYYLNNAMNLDLNDVESYYKLGIVYGVAKQYSKAIEVFEKALKIAPQSVNILNNLGISYINAKQYDKAIEVFENELKINSQDLEVLNYLVAVYRIIGKADKTKEYSKKIREIHENKQNKKLAQT